MNFTIFYFFLDHGFIMAEKLIFVTFKKKIKVSDCRFGRLTGEKEYRKYISWRKRAGFSFTEKNIYGNTK